MLSATLTMDGVKPIYGGKTIAAKFLPNLKLVKGTAVGMVTSTSANEVQTLSQASGGPATSGTFKLTFDGQETAALNYNATAAQVRAALEALPNIGTGNVTTSGGALPGTPIVITFAGALAALPQNLITVTSSTVAGSAAVYSVARTTTGVSQGRFGKYDDALSNGLNVCRGILQYDISTDNFGRVSYGSTGFDPTAYDTEAPFWYCGLFKYADIVGIDANGIADVFGRFIQGTSSTTASSLLIPGH